MAYKVLIKRSVEKELDNLPENLYKRIISRLLLLKENPRKAMLKSYEEVGDLELVLVIIEYYKLLKTKEKLLRFIPLLIEGKCIVS